MRRTGKFFLRLACPLAFLLALSGPLPTQAEGIDIQAAINSAAEDFKNGRFEEALAGYESVLAAGGPRDVLFMIGRAQQMLERWRDAERSYLRFLALDGLSSAARGRAMAELRLVEEQLSRGTLVIHVSPFGASVHMDGRLLGEAPLEPFTAPVGEVTLRVTADGYVTAERTIEVVGGERTLVAISLERASDQVSEPPPPPAPPSAPPAEPRPPARATLSPWTWVTLGTGIAILAGGTVSYVLGELDHRKVTDAAGYGSGEPVQMTRKRALDLRGSGDSKKLAGYVLWGTGGAIAATSVVLFVLDATRADEASSVQVGFVPTVGGGAMMFAGEF